MLTDKKKRRYRIRDWREYNKALLRRGSFTLRVEKRTLGVWLDQGWPARRGRRRTYTDAAALCALTLREVYGLPLRGAQGLVLG